MGRWIDSLELEKTVRYPPEERLVRALYDLSTALLREQVTPGDDSVTHWVQEAGALIVVERRRMEKLVDRSERWGRCDDRSQPSLLGAADCVIHAMFIDDSTAHTIIWLRYAEAHLRAMWKAQQ